MVSLSASGLGQNWKRKWSFVVFLYRLHFWYHLDAKYDFLKILLKSILTDSTTDTTESSHGESACVKSDPAPARWPRLQPPSRGTYPGAAGTLAQRDHLGRWYWFAAKALDASLLQLTLIPRSVRWGQPYETPIPRQCPPLSFTVGNREGDRLGTQLWVIVSWSLVSSGSSPDQS